MSTGLRGIAPLHFLWQSLQDKMSCVISQECQNKVKQGDLTRSGKTLLHDKRSAGKTCLESIIYPQSSPHTCKHDHCVRLSTAPGKLQPLTAQDKETIKVGPVVDDLYSNIYID